MQAQLLENVRTVCLDSVEAQVKRCCNVFVAFAFSHKLENLPLARGEQIVTVFLTFLFELTDIVLQPQFADCRAKK